QGKPTASQIQPLADASNAFVAIADHVTPAVVSIEIEYKNDQTARTRVLPRNVPPEMREFLDQFGDQGQRPPTTGGQGSGFIVSKDGYILTNNHVVTREDRQTPVDRVTVHLLDHRSFRARVVGNDPTTDVAVLKIEGGNLPVLPLGNDRTTRVGEWVLAIGNPLGLDFTVTAGIISAKGRSLNGLNQSRYAISDLIQTDAAINPGNSGGPLVNQRGEVIGMNSAIASMTGMNAGYGFAIPITLAKRVMEDIIKHGRARVPAIGVQITDATEDDAAVAGLKQISGVLVGGFAESGTPAEKAGMQAGDVIIAADGENVDRVSTLQRIVRNHEPGDNVPVVVMRRGDRKTFSVKLMEAPADRPARQLAENGREGAGDSKANVVSNSTLGVSVTPVTAAMAEEAKLASRYRGVRVTNVATFGPAYRKLGEDDVIFESLAPERKAIRTAADLAQLVSSVKSGGYVSLNVASQGQAGWQSRIVNIRIGE
ncbi:MAG: trypsin-like peptidase domain-containing protein, partial [Gemmatimonadaceae bacterium]|nr:trypsin-like peptidase domain-containing protein [Gemmatimonadaceae bacterium]